MNPYFTWLENEKKQTIVKISKDKNQPVMNKNLDALLEPGEGFIENSNNKENLSDPDRPYTDIQPKEGVSRRELSFFIVGTISGAIATAAGCYWGLKKNQDPAK